MKDEFFEKVLNVVEGRPFITTVTTDGQASQTIVQIREGDQGELTVVLQDELGPILGPEDAPTIIKLPQLEHFEPFAMAMIYDESMDAHGDRTVPLYPEEDRSFPFPNGETTRIINTESVALTESVSAKTLTLWYEGIRTEGWDTDVDKEAVTITHGDCFATEIPPHGTTDFFVEVSRPEPDKPPIEWDIGDTHQGVIVRTDKDKPFIKIKIAPAKDRDITWGEYTARIEVDYEDLDIKDVVLHIWRTDEAEMDLAAITVLEETISRSLSFMNSTWCQAKVAIAWKETWSDSQWRGDWIPVWGAWRATLPARRNRHKNWMPIETNAEKVLEEVLSNIQKDHHPVIERYLHNTMALDRGDWISSVTASVAILQRLATNSGLKTGRRGLELWQGIAQYLRSKAVERPYNYVGWEDEAKRLIEEGKAHDHLAKAITELRNLVTAHWVNDPPENATWLAQQALYYVESALRAELAPGVPMWDRTRAFHHPPIQDSIE